MKNPIYIIQGSEKRLNAAYQHSLLSHNSHFLLTSWGMNNTKEETAEYRTLEKIALNQLNIPQNKITTSPIGIDRITSFIGIQEFMEKNKKGEFFLPIERFHLDNYMRVIQTLYPKHNINPIPIKGDYPIKYKLVQSLAVGLPIRSDIMRGELSTIEKQNQYLKNINKGNGNIGFQGIARYYFSKEVKKSHREVCLEFE